MKGKIFRFVVLALAVTLLLPLGTSISAVTVTYKQIPSIALTMYQPKAGDPIINYYVSTTTPHITVKNDSSQVVIDGTRWNNYPNPNPSESIGGYFDDGVYYYRVHISADFSFLDNIIYTLPDASKVTLNGIPACAASGHDPHTPVIGPAIYDSKTYVFPITIKRNGIRIDYFSFNCKMPKQGEVSKPITVTSSNPHVKIKRMYWSYRDGVESPEFVFESRNKYYLNVEIVCDDGYYVTGDSKSYIPGMNFFYVKRDKLNDARNATVIFYFDLNEKYIGYFFDTCIDAWYSNSVRYCLDNGYMSGISPIAFRPATALTRAMFLQILAKVKGVDLAEYEYSGEFYDVPYGRWFTNAVEWAYETGVTAGTGEHQFSPDMPVTREQLATFLYAADGDETDSDLSKYTDANTVSPWALHAVKWCIGKSYISGTSATTLSPRENTTRAQAAVIFMNYAKSINK